MKRFIKRMLPCLVVFITCMLVCIISDNNVYAVITSACGMLVIHTLAYLSYFWKE